MKGIIYILLLVMSVSFWSCETTNSTNTNFVNLYSRVGEVFNPKYMVYHPSIDSTYLHFKLTSSEMLYARKDKTQPYNASATIHYKIYDVLDRKILLDSATVMVKDESVTKESRFIFGNIGMKLPYGKNYNLYITATDINRNAVSEYLISVNKTSLSNPQFFKLIEQKSKLPKFQNFSLGAEECLLLSEANADKPIYVNYYNRNFPIAAPPFSMTNSKTFNYRPDSAIGNRLDDKGYFKLNTLDSGFVHVMLDSSQRTGYSHYTYNQNYPTIYDAEGMIEPMKYISSKAEYLKMMESEDPRKEMESFWLSKCGSKERAREIIKKYYNRVENANASFTSYIAGWQTDRGMVSLIFGFPKTIRKTNDQEVWVYGEESNIMALQFTFDQVDNPFSDNDFKLQRSPGYKSNWYRAVDAWRSGRVYWAQ
ncbi:MAG: GWxTD domain-containing protein [Parvicella sp.]|jgi:GWxTD domain-containing protein